MKFTRQKLDQSPPFSTKVVSDYVKGVCIIIVCWHHLIYNNFEGRFSYLGHQFVVFFFILSGYGIYKSLDSGKNNISTLSGIFLYVLKRAARIYPLYWLVVFISFKSIRPSFLDFFLLSLDSPPVWFLNAIVYCYIFAPGMYFVARRTGLLFIVINVAAALIVNGALDLLRVPVVLNYAYCKIYFSYVFSFGCGMALAKPINLTPRPFITQFILVLSCFCFLVSALQITMFGFDVLRMPYVRIIYYPVNPYVFIFFGSAVLIVFLLVNVRVYLPLGVLLGKFGKYSLPIYLFHDYTNQIIIKLLGLSQPIWCYFLAFLLFLPFLLIGSALVQRISDRISGQIVRRLTGVVASN